MRTLLALTCCIGLAAAQDGKEMADMLCAAIDSGQAANVLEGLQGGFAEVLAGDLDGAHRVCEMAARRTRRFAARDAETWRHLAEAIVALGTLVAERNANDGTALAGRGEALLCRARVAAVLHDKPRPEDWRDAVECFLKAHEADPAAGKRIVRAIRAAQEGASLEGADPALAARGRELLDLAEKTGTKGPELREFLFDQERNRIEEALVRDRKEAKKLLEDRIAALGGSLVDQKDPPMVEATAYNDFVTLARREKKLGVAAKYLTRQEKLGNNVLAMDVPVSSRWKWRAGDLGTLYQYDPDGSLVRTITFRTYSWEKLYTLDGQEFGGDNLKGLARLGEQDVLTVIVSPKSRKPLMRRRFNAKIPQCQAFEIGGLDKDGDYVKFTTFYFKAKETRLTTFRVSLLDMTDTTIDPEAEAVIDSIRELTH